MLFATLGIITFDKHVLFEFHFDLVHVQQYNTFV